MQIVVNSQFLLPF